MLCDTETCCWVRNDSDPSEDKSNFSDNDSDKSDSEMGPEIMMQAVAWNLFAPVGFKFLRHRHGCGLNFMFENCNGTTLYET